MKTLLRTTVLLLPLTLALAACQEGELTTGLPPAGAAFNQGQSKSEVCHFNSGTNAYQRITIADPALPTHIAHGDAMPGAGLSDHSALLNDNCVPVAVVLDPANSYSTALYGGTGGLANTQLCPAGSVALGIDGLRGREFWSGAQLIGKVRLACAELRGDASFGASSATGFFGQGLGFEAGTEVTFSGSCTAGQVLTAGIGNHIGISAAFVVSQVGGNCATLSRILSAAGGSDSSIGPWGTDYGNPFFAGCNAGDVITGITGNAGWLADRIGFVCTPVRQRAL